MMRSVESYYLRYQSLADPSELAIIVLICVNILKKKSVLAATKNCEVQVQGQLLSQSVKKKQLDVLQRENV